MSVAFTAPGPVLRRLVDRVVKVVERRNTIPILSNVVIGAEGDGRLTVQGTDLDAWITASEPAGAAKVEMAGITTVPAQLLADILKKVPSGDVSFQAKDGKQATLEAGKARFKLLELPAADFPIAADFEPAITFDIEPKALKRIAADCGFAISTEETRYYLNGVYLHGRGPDEEGDEKRLTAVATDGHKLSRLTLPLADDLTGMPGIIVPKKTVGLFNHVADSCDDGEAIAVRVSDSFIELETHALRLRSKLIDGTFPDYGRVIPAANDKRTTIRTAALAGAVDRVATVSAERGRAVRLTFTDAETLELAVTSPDAGEGTDSVMLEASEWNGADYGLAIGFNARYLADILNSFDDAEHVCLALADPGSPTVITDPADEARLVVLMPMRV